MLGLNDVVWDVDRWARTPLRVRTGGSFAIHEESIVLHVVGGGGGCFHQRRHISLLPVAPPGGRAGALQLVSTITVAPTVVFAFTFFFYLLE